MDRAGSYNSDSIRKDKTEKRRSGFFGLGKKDKDKEVVREKNVSWQLVPIGSWDWRWGRAITGCRPQPFTRHERQRSAS